MAKNGLPEEMLRRLNLNLLIVFDAVMRTGSVSRAAHNLDISQSAVSHALQKLRQFFGDELFIRSGNGIVPTSKAQAMGGTIATLVEMLRASLLTQEQFTPAAAARTITFFLNDYSELEIMPRFSAFARKAAPNCPIRVVQPQPDELAEKMESGAINLAISGPACIAGDILQQRLYTSEFTVVASWESRISGPLSLADFAEIDQLCVRPTRPDSLPIDTVLSEMGVERREVLATLHTMSVPDILMANPDMISIVPTEFAARQARAGLLKMITTNFELPVISVFQFWHRRFHADPFNMWLRQSMRDLNMNPGDKLLNMPQSRMTVNSAGLWQ